MKPGIDLRTGEAFCRHAATSSGMAPWAIHDKLPTVLMDAREQ
jgi:hypothetical protein